MEQTHLPNLSTISETETQGSFCVEPLLPGYASTLGNALRRVLLSSLEGAAVDYVTIEGVDHEFSTVPQVKEDVIQIILNLKLLRFSLQGEEAELHLEAKGSKLVTAADFSQNADCKIINQDQVIASLDDGADLKLRIGVKKGIGYEPVDKKTERTKAVGVITIDSIFSPVQAVSYTVENTRVGQMTNFDRLLIDIQTDGSILASNALKEASRILSDHYQAIAGLTPINTESTEEIESAGNVEELIVTDDSFNILQSMDAKTRIEDSGLSGRATHALTSAGYKTLAGLKRLSEIKLQGIKGLGSKGVEEVNALLTRVK